MAVYEMNRKALAEYLSDTINEFAFKCNTSKECQRINKHGDAYPIKIVDIKQIKNVIPKVDCFLNKGESITVRVYLPKYDFIISTSELHKAYDPQKYLGFSFFAEPRSFEYTISNTKVESYNDFKDVMDDMLRRISNELRQDINKFETKEEWHIHGIYLDVSFDIHSMNTK